MLGCILGRLRLGGHGQRLRAPVVPRDDRQREQDFVLDQRMQVERLLHRKDIVVALGIQPRRLVLVAHESNGAVHLDRDAHGLQAALAGHPDAAVRVQVQPPLRIDGLGAAEFAARGPGHRFGRCVLRHDIAQALEGADRFVAIERGAVGRERSDVQAPRFVRAFHADQCTARQNRLMHLPLVLASTSRYRRELLERLRVPFDTLSPQVDETPLPGEDPARLAVRLALAKARSGAALRPEAVVIGSDQVAELDGTPIGKPGSHERAAVQLRAMSGRRVVFHTAVAVARLATGFERAVLAPVDVIFRALSDADIERYLQLEQPFDCAGSAKAEALGIVLLQEIRSDDPTALIGLPLIRTCALLRAAGLDPLAA